MKRLHVNDLNKLKYKLKLLARAHNISFFYSVQFDEHCFNSVAVVNLGVYFL